MGSSLSPSSPLLSINDRYLLPRCDVYRMNPVTNFHISRRRRLCLSPSVAERKLEASWLLPDGDENDDYRGWAIDGTRVEKNKGLTTYFLAGVGTSLAILLAAIAHRSLTRKGFKFKFNTQLHALQGMLNPFEIEASEGNHHVVSEANLEHTSKEMSEILTSASVQKFVRVVIPMAVDSTQQEALLVLKKLKIIENDIKADELCTRREYARWLVKANSLLERNLNQRIVPSKLLAGSVVGVFDDVSTKDPDFVYIQALAEAGIVLSKLSDYNSYYSDQDDFKGQGRVDFFPDSFISRLDLINWKAQLEYSFIVGIEEKISRTKVGFMDVRKIRPVASPELFMDMLAGDKSILKKVFGQSKRLQPSNPATRAQAAVALTSGRIAEAINTELSRLEAENSSREAEMEEIRSELIGMREIQEFWEEKLNEEKACGFEVERDFLDAVHVLEQEKSVRDKSLTEYLKEKAALDCQKLLLLTLKEEVNKMSERLACEKASFLSEKKTLVDVLIDSLANQEAMRESKSILEAEKEALQILRSWVEDEAGKNQARAKFLEEARRRWEWDYRA